MSFTIRGIYIIKIAISQPHTYIKSVRTVNKVQIQITLPKMADYPRRVNYPSSGTTAFRDVLFSLTVLRNIYGIVISNQN